MIFQGMNLDSVLEGELKVTVGNAMCNIASLSADLVNIIMHPDPYFSSEKYLLVKLYILTYNYSSILLVLDTKHNLYVYVAYLNSTLKS